MTRLLHRSVGLSAGALAVLVGGVVLLGWALDIAALKSVLPGWTAMKPNAALAFILTGIALLSAGPRSTPNLDGSQADPQLATPWSHAGRLCAWVAGLIGLLSLCEYAFGWNPGFDQWLFPEPGGAVGTSHPGRMAPDTALCFVLFLAGWEFARRPRQSNRRWAATLLFGATMTALALVEILSYLTPTLRTYGWGGLTMMALPTATVFAALGVALILTSASGKPSASDLPARGTEPSEARAGLRFVLVFIGLAIGITATGMFYYRTFERQYKTEVEKQLANIAELKVAELAQWRKERLGDANIWFKNPSLSILVRRCFAQPPDTDAERQIQGWLDKYKMHFRYDQVRLLDARGVNRLSAPADLPPVSSILAKDISEALRSDQVVFRDHYISDNDQELRLALLIPIFDESGGRRPLGVLFLRIDPDQYLHPAIQRWPALSASGETLLLRREGNEARYLNDLRHRPDGNFVLRIPLTRTEVPAVRAVLGQTGIMQGTDYRGVPVVAYEKAVPGSPWFLEAKLDLAEVYMPIRSQLWQVIAMVGILLLGAGSSVGLFWREQRLRFHRARSEAVEALRDNELKFRTLFETTADAHLLFADGRWIDCNAAAACVFGCAREQIIGAHPSRFSPPTQPDGRSSEEESIKLINLAFTVGPQAFEWEHCRADGAPFPAEVALNRIDLGGKPHMQAIVRDITEHKQAAAALQVEKQNMDAIFESSPVAMFILDETTNIVRVNPAAVVLTGGSPADALQHPPGNALGCVHSSKDPRGCGYSAECPLCPVRNGIEALLASGGTMHGAELELELVRNGAPQKVWMEIGAEPVQIGGRRHLCVAMEDLTERRRATEALQKSEEKYRTLIDNLTTAVVVHGPDTSILLFNAMALSLLGLSEDQMLGKTAMDPQWGFLQEDGSPMPLGDYPVNLVITSGEAFHGQVIGVVHQGRTEPVWVLCNGYPVKDEQGRVVQAVITFADITKQKRAEEALLQSRKAALNLLRDAMEARDLSEQISAALRASEESYRQLNASLEQRVAERTAELSATNQELEAFSYSVSHDLRAPLRSIDGFSRIVQEDYAAKLDDEGRDSLARIRAAAQRMAQLIDDLLKLSRISRIELLREPVDLSALANSVAADLRRQEPDRAVELVVAEGLTAQGDPRLLRVVLENLLGNAWKFTGKREHARIDFGAEPQNGRATWFVRDNGAGFDAAHAEKLFGAFQRLHSSEEFPGTGIGLATVQRVVRRHGGRVWAEGTVGHGATFWFNLSTEPEVKRRST